MSRNGAGVYSPPISSFPAVATTLIESAKYNNVINDLSSAITGSIAADGQTIITADLPMNSHKFTGLASGSGAGHSVEYAQVSGTSTGQGAGLVGFIQTGTGAVARKVKDKLNEMISVKDFGAVGDGAADDTAAIQAAINSATSGMTVFFPAGFYKITATINLPNTYILRLVGQGMYASRIYATASMSKIFTTNAAVIYDTFEIKDLGFLCNSLAGSAFVCEQLIHSLIDRVLVTGATSTAIRINNGYNNTIQNCIFTGNAGNALDISGANNNNINVRQNQIYSNTGYGIIAADGLNINIVGNGIETNTLAGIIAYDVKALNIEGNYFERNSATGVAFSAPEVLTVKADIFILSGGKVLTYTSGQTVECCRIVGNHFTPYGTGNIPTAGLSIDCNIFSTAIDKMTVENNQIYDITKITGLIGTYNNNNNSLVMGAKVGKNSANSLVFLGTGNIQFAIKSGHNALFDDTIASIIPHNYASQDLNLYSIISGTTGTLVKSSQRLAKDYPAWELSTGDHIYGYTISLSSFPELKGNYVWFGVYYRIQDATGTGFQLRLSDGITTSTDNDGTVTETITTAGTWVFKSVAKLISPSSTSLVIMMSRTGGAGNPVVVAMPVLTMMGNDLSRFPVPTQPPVMYGSAAPTTGNWLLGERVINSSPAVGQPKAWTCTVAGSPGTWVSEGNL
ncbi:MAG: glycosyl hydrolase family 28-related protein [Methylobacter sp.]